MKVGTGRKYGRIRRKPSHLRYNEERHDIKNKKRRMQRTANLTNKDVRGKIEGKGIVVNPNKL